MIPQTVLRFLVVSAILCLPVRAADPVEFGVGNFTFERPEGWQWVPSTSAMRKAEMSIPAEDGKDAAEVVFFHFGPGQGGSVDANIARWLNQFEGGAQAANPKVSQAKAGGMEIYFVEAKGTFLKGMPGQPGTPMPNYGMLAVILVDGTGGDVYVKMTGPEAAVQKAAEAFRKMIIDAAERRMADGGKNS